MESSVILSHKLIELNIIIILPPCFPIIIFKIGAQVSSSNRYITDWSVEPNIKHFIFIILMGNWSTPFQISCDAPSMKTFFQEIVSEKSCVFTPFTFNGCFIDPLFQIRGNFCQINENVFG